MKQQRFGVKWLGPEDYESAALSLHKDAGLFEKEQR